mmetsp:Transcript_22202/g.46428  ORF Transcript_22202/g.46428 Transcript_22202/m.46428 type:complete len:305 (+) Transcript_22202:47-961(+)
MRSRVIAIQRRSSSSNSTTPITTTTIKRHGPGDGVITLNVGGKKFQTLRSTIAQNEVLMDHVVRAESNREIVTGWNKAIFIDRDHQHFGTILAYLRNKADGIYRRPGDGARRRLMKFGDKISNNNNNSNNKCQTIVKEAATKHLNEAKSTMPSASSYIPQLPKDPKTLTEIYFESLHYNIPELTNHLSSKTTLTRLLGIFGSKNPLQLASTVMVTGRRMLVLFGTMLTGMGGWAYSEAMAVQAKALDKTYEIVSDTKEFVSDTKDFCHDGVDDLVNESGFWKKQADGWKIISDKWNGRSREGDE